MENIILTDTESKYIGKARQNIDFRKFEERCQWAREESSQNEINGAILMTRICGLDFTANSYFEKIKNKKQYKLIHRRPTFVLFLEPDQSTSLYPFNHSKIVIFDIDQRNNKKLVDDIVKEIRLELGDPFYIEYGRKRCNRKYEYEYLYSKKPSGAHLYYQFDDYIPDYALKAIEKKFALKGSVIEPIYNTSTIRLPMTSDVQDYKYFGYEVLKHQKEITDMRKTGLHLKDLKLSYYELWKCFKQANDKSNPVPEWLSTVIDEEDFRKVKKLRTYNPLQTSDYKDDSSSVINLQNYVNTNNQKTISNGFNHDRVYGFNPDRVYGRGTRIKHQIAIGFDVIRSGESYNQFKVLCERYNDGTSKDMNLPVDKKEIILKGVWDYCTLKFNTDNPYQYRSSFNSNGYYHDEDFDISESEYIKITNMVNYYYLIDDWGKALGKDQDNFVYNVVKMYTQLKEKAIHDKITEGKYSYTFLKPMEEGIALSQKLIKCIAKDYNIKNHNKVIKFLTKYNFIEPIGIEVNGHTQFYSYKHIRYCKHYKVHTIQDCFNNVKRNFIQSQLSKFIIKLNYLETINSKSPSKYIDKLISLIKDIYKSTPIDYILHTINIYINKITSSSKSNEYIPINNVFNINYTGVGIDRPIVNISIENLIHPPPL